MADSPGRGSIRGQRRRDRDLHARPSPPASTQQNARQRAQGDSGSRPSSFVYNGSGDDLLMPPPSGPGLRAMESRFSLNEQFAASRRDYEFDDDDAESILEPAPILRPSDNPENVSRETLQKDEGEELSDTERAVQRLLQADINPVDYYALLGLNSQGNPPPTATQIRAAYHRLSLAFHPDKHPRSLKAAAERHFTSLQKAYETLIEPRKRIIYDLEGEEGVQNEYRDGGCMGRDGEAERQIGVKSMGPDEFKIWFINILQQRERRSIEDLVGSSGTCKLVLNAQRLFDNSPRAVKWVNQDGNGVKRLEDPSMPRSPISPVLPAALQLRQSFSVPLPGLGDRLRIPFPSWREAFRMKSEEGDLSENNFSRSVVTAGPGVPRLTFTGAVGGDIKTSMLVMLPSSDQAHTIALPSSPWYSLTSDKFQISTRLHGAFPETSDRADKRSIASKFQGTDFDITAGLIPMRTLNIGLGRPLVLIKDTKPFYCNFQTYFNHSLLLKPPVFGVRVARSLGGNHVGYLQSSSGDFQWPDFISHRFPVSGVPLWLPRGQLLPTMKIGYIWSDDGKSRAFTTDEDDDMLDLEVNDGKENHQVDLGRSFLSHESWHIGADSSPINTAISATYGCDLMAHTPEPPVRSRIRNNGEAMSTSHRITIPPPRGIRLEIEADVSLQSSLGGVVRGVRRVGDFTSIGLGIGINHRRGLYISISWSRLGQNLILPVVLVPADQVNIHLWLTAVAIPCVTYIFTEFVILRPWTARKRSALVERKRQQLRANVEEHKLDAEQAVQLMQPLVNHRQAIEREQGGLVILSAEYGVRETRPGLTNTWRSGEVADVTTALAALVDAGQLSLPRGTHKSQIIGFFDAAPLKKKVLVVEYLFAGNRHRVECVGSEGLVLPQEGHEI